MIYTVVDRAQAVSGDLRCGEPMAYPDEYSRRRRDSSERIRHRQDLSELRRHELL